MPGEVPARTTLTSGSSRALIICEASHTLPPTRDLRPPGTRAGLQVHLPVPPAIMPTDFTILMTGSDFLSGRMANFPGESRWDEAQLSNTPCSGVRQAETLSPSRGFGCGDHHTRPSPSGEGDGKGGLGPAQVPRGAGGWRSRGSQLSPPLVCFQPNKASL